MCVTGGGKFGWAPPSVFGIFFFFFKFFTLFHLLTLWVKLSWKYELVKMLNCVVLAAIIKKYPLHLRLCELINTLITSWKPLQSHTT